jgi:hypothetical protein
VAITVHYEGKGKSQQQTVKLEHAFPQGKALARAPSQRGHVSLQDKILSHFIKVEQVLMAI